MSSDSSLDRRRFIAGGATSLAFLAGTLACRPNEVRNRKAFDVVKLGRSGLLASRQGVGLGDGTAESFQRMGQAGFTRFLRHALDQGARSFDLLPGPVHGMVASALQGIPRESYTLVTNFRHPVETDPRKMIDSYLRELRTDYVDAILVGAILAGNWATETKWAERRDLLEAAKQAGKVRAHGVSVHGWEALRSVAADPWVELALVSCNHLGAWMDGPPGRVTTDLEKRDQSVPVIQAIHRAGIGTAAMKVFSHSGYRDTPAPAAERLAAIRYVMSTDAVDTMPILCESVREFDEVTRLIDRAGIELAAAR